MAAWDQELWPPDGGHWTQLRQRRNIFADSQQKGESTAAIGSFLTV